MRTPMHKRDNEVQAARSRLRGVLNESLQNQEVDDIPEDYEEEEEEGEEEEEEKPVVPQRQRGRPRKIQPITERKSPTTDFLTPNKRRRHTGGSNNQKIQAESFVMKLFDRSLDLSKYSEQTALYPISRAWMVNQPRNPSLRSYRDAISPPPAERKENGPEIVAKLRKGDLWDITSMPKPKESDVPKIPPPREAPKKYGKYEEIISADNKLNDCKAEEILADHLRKWKQVKTSWKKHTKLYQQRYELSFQILDHLFKPYK